VKLVLGLGGVLVAGLLVGLLLALRGGRAPTPTPFDDGDLGASLAGCARLCEQERACGTARQPERCLDDCQILAAIVVGAPTCARPIRATLACWWRATLRCAPEDACAGPVGATWDCVCKLADAPASCRQR
jgi:hypothetical protein